MQARFTVQLAPGEQKVLEGRYEFRRLSREGTLRVEVGRAIRSSRGCSPSTGWTTGGRSPWGRRVRTRSIPRATSR